jgi:uncharacterized RDD family membrane protein YckC
MGNGLWYYVDAAGKQVGPVSAEELRAALQRGAATMETLAWRDGLAGWAPIRELAAELGLGAAAASPPPPPVVAGDDANPYRAPQQVTGEGYVAGQDVVYAGFWRRWAALFVDQIVLGLPLGIIFFFLALAMGLTGGLMNSREPQVGAILGMEFLFYVIWWTAALFYYAGLESSEAQATFGKRALGIKVTDAEGRRLSFKHAAGRWFAAALSYMSLYVGFLMAGFTQRKQALHDVIAGTLVVDKWAFTANPERQERKLSGCLIAFMVLVLGGLILVPIVIAIAVAQYAEYARRAGQAWVEPSPQGTTLCVTPASSEYVARRLPPSFEA